MRRTIHIDEKRAMLIIEKEGKIAFLRFGNKYELRQAFES